MPTRSRRSCALRDRDAAVEALLLALSWVCIGHGLLSVCHEQCSAVSAGAPRASMQPAIIACGRTLASTSCGAIVERHLQQRCAVGVVGAVRCAVMRQVPDPTRVVSCADLHAHISSCAPPPSSPQDATIVGREAPCHCGDFRREWHIQRGWHAQQVAPASTRDSSERAHIQVAAPPSPMYADC